MKTNVYNTKGEVAREFELPESIFGLEWNADLVHQVAVGMQSNARSNTAHTKDRSEVRGGGRKPWRQKGTGQARHGSRRSPIWAGGGVTFGPRAERNYSKKINKKMSQKALLIALAEKVRSGQVLFVDTLESGSNKTKDIVASFKALEKADGFETINTKKHNNIFFASPELSDDVKAGAKNIHHVNTAQLQNINVLDVLNNRYLVLEHPEKTVEFLETKLTNK